MTIHPKHELGTKVWLLACSSACGIVTGYTVRPGNVIMYLVSFATEEGPNEQNCLLCELTGEPTYGAPTGDD